MTRPPPRERDVWLTARGELPLDVPRIMGILNVTPDSFSDGGRYTDLDAALRHAGQLLEEGADILDIGGESTRPGARPITVAAECARVLPVVREVLARWPDAIISVDTVKAEVARAALDAGAAIINDVSALRLDPAMAATAAQYRAGLVLMHSRGSIAEMADYATAAYDTDPVGEIVDELSRAVNAAAAAEVAAEAIVVDPGIGFSKRTEHSVAVLAELHRLLALGFPVLVGPSRKRFIGELTGGQPAAERIEGTIAACVAALMRGARIFRLHDVAPARKALRVAEAIRLAGRADSSSRTN